MTTPTLMAVYCSECDVLIREKPGLGETRPSHGLCDPCFNALMARYDAEDGPPEDADLTYALDGTAPEVEELDLSRFERVLRVREEEPTP